jgi:chemotaxis protein CheX
MKSVNELPAAKGSHEAWIPILEVAAREVFELMLGCQLSVTVSPGGSPLNITALVGLTGILNGVLSVRCDGKAAALMASKMLGVELDKVGPEVPDALGEVCNMVAGNFKNKIAGLGDGCMLSPPTIITGSDYTLHSHTGSSTFEVRLLFENMPMVISLLIQT